VVRFPRPALRPRSARSLSKRVCLIPIMISVLMSLSPTALMADDQRLEGLYRVVSAQKDHKDLQPMPKTVEVDRAKGRILVTDGGGNALLQGSYRETRGDALDYRDCNEGAGPNATVRQSR
jgi:hypothetical protein